MSESSPEKLLLRKIRDAQPENGVFLSERYHPQLPLSRTDDNIFFTASVLFVLQTCKARLTPVEQELVAEITIAGKAAYPKYRNKQGHATYNFYRTNPSQHFPNGMLMHRLRHFELPDDADCTALIYLTNGADKEQAEWLHQKLPLHANLSRLQVKTTLPAAKNLPAYSTWFGKSMPIEFDACVLSNILFLVYQQQLPLTVHDQASLQFLKLVITSGGYFRNPFKVAPSYPNAAIILYHLVRLVGSFAPEELAPLRNKLAADIEHAWQQSKNLMERVLLDTCRIRLGSKSLLRVTASDIDRKEVQEFAWFTAAFLSPFSNPVMHWLAKFPLFQMKFSCPAMSYALLLEHEVNRKRTSP